MRSILIVFFLLTITGVVFPQKLLKLEDAINLAFQRNTSLQISKNNIEAYESGVKASYGSILPSLGASGAWQWNRTEGGTTVIEGIQTPIPTTESRTYSAGAGGDWVLFDGLANIASISQSNNDLDAAKFSLERLKQDIVFQTITLYYAVINAKQLLKVNEDDVKQAQKNLETITERNKLGAVTLADVYAQQVTLGNAELDKLRTANSLETAKADLLYYLGLDVTEEYTFPDDFSDEELELLENRLDQEYGNISILASDAMDNRFDYKSALLRLESANDAVTIARAGHFPRLVNNFGFRSGAEKIGDLFKFNTYSVGLTLSLPIFAGFSIEDRVEVASVNALNQEVELSDLERDIKRNLQQTYLDLQALEKALDVSKKNVEAAGENLRIEEEKYSLGSSKLLDVLTATTNFTDARVNFINAQFAYIVSSERLKYNLGTLDYKQYE